MKKNRLQLVNWFLSLIALIALVIVISLVIALRPQGEPQGSDIQPLEERLRELGVPIKSIAVTSQSPLEIEVVLQDSGSEEKLDQDDLWNKLLTVRELEFAYLNFEIPVERYRLVVVTPKGDQLFGSTTFLYPDSTSQKIIPAPPSSVENSETADIVRENLDVQGLTLITLDVPSSYTDRYNSKLISLELSTGTSADKTDIEPINRLVFYMRPQIEAINERYGTRIVLVRARIRDSNNNLLVDYMEDFELGRRSSWTAENIEGGWYSTPAETDSPAGLEETAAPIITPATPTATPPLPNEPPAPTEPYPSP